MSTQKHTPGPWSVYRGDDIRYTESAEITAPFSDPDCETMTICRVMIAPIEHEANATLIAAAPDLLEALKGILIHADNFNTLPRALRDNARTAIAKAGGTP